MYQRPIADAPVRPHRPSPPNGVDCRPDAQPTRQRRGGHAEAGAAGLRASVARVPAPRRRGVKEFALEGSNERADDQPPSPDRRLCRRRSGRAAEAGTGVRSDRDPAHRRRGRRRRGLCRAHRRASHPPQGPLGDRPRGAKPGRRPGPQPPDRRRRGLRAGRHLRRAHPGPHPRPGEGVRGDQVPHLRQRRQRLRQLDRPAEHLQRHGPVRHRAAGPRDHRGPRAGGGQARPDVDPGAGQRPVDVPERRRLGRSDARHLDPRQQRQPAVPRPRPGGDAADLRRRAARALAPLHPLLHRRVRQRAEPRDVRAQLQHPRRRPDVALPRRHPAPRAEGRQGPREPDRPQLPGRADRPGRRRRHGPVPQPPGARQARHRRHPPHARGPDRVHAPPAGQPRPAHPAPAPGHADQGDGRLRPPVLARAGAERAGGLLQGAPPT